MATGYEDTYRDLHQPAVVIGGCFAIVAVLLSIYLIFQHLKSYTNPAEQKWIVAVIFMVPVYATQSILSLWNPRMSVASDILRNCYEAFALYSFGSYLVACLGGERSVIELLENESRGQLGITLLERRNGNQAVQSRSFTSFFFRPYAIGRDLLTIERFGLVQYHSCWSSLGFSVMGNSSGTTGMYYLCHLLVSIHSSGTQLQPDVGTILPRAVLQCNARTTKTNKATGKVRQLQGYCVCHLVARPGYCSPLGPWSSAKREKTPNRVARLFDLHRTEPYRFIPVSGYGRVTTETTKAEMKFGGGDQEKSAVFEKRETQVAAPGTSVSESVQDIVLEGGQSVVKDVVLTINQAIGPVEKGVTKIQEKIHQRFVGSKDKEASELQVEECVEENLTGEQNI
ncbi:protein LAZ1 homolog 2 isoform X2 [Populus trichocarpa]|uniref:protein LAZ1 homolog 2 isoform X2 n=1 Tax=Populus trichocarpa TaxID=3694 RepID=UPI000D188A72|nr:protein LAZ1 homolog 2 isoform X2 [Populus trichocarpa]|eukprot:XP_024446212.1 protein LAZ1 homolog 2 isoform X2 [Populus trichocarpa]